MIKDHKINDYQKHRIGTLGNCEWFYQPHDIISGIVLVYRPLKSSEIPKTVWMMN